jgi:hypothetical protein
MSPPTYGRSGSACGSALKQRRRRSSSRPSTCLSAAKSIACISRQKWISGPITTVRLELMSPKAPAVARVGLTAWRWLSESSRSGTVVLGNHPNSARRIVGGEGRRHRRKLTEYGNKCAVVDTIIWTVDCPLRCLRSRSFASTLI